MNAAANWSSAVEELKADGLGIRIRHLRRLRLKPGADPKHELMTVGAFNALNTPENALKIGDLFEIDAQGGVTICEIYVLADRETIIATGQARTSRRDAYAKQTGRAKSIGRALHALKKLRDEGKLVIPAPEAA